MNITNATIEAIKNRRSSRQFKTEQLSKEHIMAIISCGLSAPSAHDEQPWLFSIVKNKSFLADFNEEAKKGFADSPVDVFRVFAKSPEFNIFYDAPLVVFVSGNNDTMFPEAMLNRFDCAAATENMLIAAESIGVGSCWIGLAAYGFAGERKAEFMKKLKIPANYTPFYAVSFGYKRADSLSGVSKAKDGRVVLV